MANRSTAGRMARLVARWRESGESGARFARRHRIRPWTFWYWSRKLATGPRAESSPTRTPTFVPVHVSADASVIEIVLTSGDRLHVRAGASVDLVQAAVSALRSRC